MTQELARIIEEIKKAESLTQYEVAERLGYDHTYLSQLMNGKKPVSKKVIEKVKLTFPSAGKIIENKSTQNPNQADTKKPELLQVMGDASKIDLILHIIQQHSGELKGLNRKLNEIEQQQIVTAAIQTSFQEYLVSRLDTGSDPELTVVEMQRKAFEKLTRIQTGDMKNSPHSLHR